MGSGYIREIKRALEMYRKSNYWITARGSCNICLGRKQVRGDILCFDYKIDGRDVEDFFHRECLEKLLDPENFSMFVIETRRKEKKLKS